MARSWNDLRSGFGMLLKNPAVTVVAVVALALGVGANSPAFSLDKENCRLQAKARSRVEDYRGTSFTLLNDAESDNVNTGVVSAHFFELLGVKPILGRGFVEADDRPGAEPVLLLSHRYWMTKHHGDPKVVGKHFRLNDRVLTVIGVLPPMPQYSSEDDIYMTTMACPFRTGMPVIETRS